jgi:hypothetical protein
MTILSTRQIFCRETLKPCVLSKVKFMKATSQGKASLKRESSFILVTKCVPIRLDF